MVRIEKIVEKINEYYKKNIEKYNITKSSRKYGTYANLKILNENYKKYIELCEIIDKQYGYIFLVDIKHDKKNPQEPKYFAVSQITYRFEQYYNRRYIKTAVKLVYKQEIKDHKEQTLTTEFQNFFQWLRRNKIDINKCLIHTDLEAGWRNLPMHLVKRQDPIVNYLNFLATEGCKRSPLKESCLKYCIVRELDTEPLPAVIIYRYKKFLEKQLIEHKKKIIEKIENYRLFRKIALECINSI